MLYPEAPKDMLTTVLRRPISIALIPCRNYKRRYLPTRLYDLRYSEGVSTWHSNARRVASPGRVLISYITSPFRLAPQDPANVRFSNVGIARTMVRALNDLGYVVDLIDYDDARFVPKQSYDLFIGHAGNNFERIARRLPTGATTIYFATGSYWSTNNGRELERLGDLQRRRGVWLPPERLVTHSEEWANKHADGIICLGNTANKETFVAFPVVYALNNAAYFDAHYDMQSKDFEAGRRNVLYFAGPGNVHKGLDLLLEAFDGLDAHLYICQHVRPDFAAIYRRELRLPNVHLIGHIAMRSPRFYDLANRCNVVISPSCSEASQGAIIECMHQGLIPIMSKESTIDAGDYGITLQECTVGEIASVVKDVTGRPTAWHKIMSHRTRQATITDFSEEAFYRNMKRAICQIHSYTRGQRRCDLT